MKILESMSATPAQTLIDTCSGDMVEGVYSDMEANEADEVWISWFQSTKESERGAGAKGLAFICAKADELGVTIQLRVATGDPEEPADKVVDFYLRHGFAVTEIDGDGDTFMKRVPA